MPTVMTSRLPVRRGYLTRDTQAARRRIKRDQAHEAGRGVIESARAVRAAEIERLDEELCNLNVRVTAGDHAAAARILDLTRRRAALARIRTALGEPARKENP